ncbi:sensor histidine kinase [Rubrobacter indicoceani]|uniref:sensor histidine kinase n=1 Tax=Rubrobacter indicoceani TaxID=2051957 RepID=UPI000E5A1485|nr:HAMP domain-containing sensor histidine kinase [Rubrobacter indicoceani]
MDLKRLRLRLTLGYLGISALILTLVLVASVVGFSWELIEQQDTLLIQEARTQSRNVLRDEDRPTLAEDSSAYGWVALDPEAMVTARDPASERLGLPDPGLARESFEKETPVSRTLQGEDGSVRVVSLPVYGDEEQLVGALQYAHSLRSTQERVNRLILVLLPLGLGGLGLGAIGGLLLAGRAVRPARDSFERQRVFIADASHELKTPLTLIRADAEVLRRSLERNGDQLLADDILSEVDRMNAILSDLLLVARLDAGKLDLKREVFDLSQTILKVAERFRSRAEAGGVALETPGEDRLLALGDDARTEQVLAVLVDNALTYTPPGGTVSVLARRTGAEAEATVRDAGAGIAEDHLPHVFERFYRADSARTPGSGGGVGGGTGLGLAIARDLARAQGGDLCAGNAPGGGASFRLSLPAC